MDAADDARTNDASERGGVRLAFGKDVLERTFPWHVVVDGDLRVRSAGRVFRRFIPVLEDVTHLDSFLRTLEPENVELTPRTLRQLLGKCWSLECVQLPKLVLRGEFAPMMDGLFVFLGGPRISLDAVRCLGLTAADFAAHESFGECLFLVEAQQASLAEALRLSNEINGLNGRLEELVAERTRELDEANVRLEREKRERERIEAELRLAHRLEAVGQLASGVAHEINTPIQYIGDSVQFLNEAYVDLVKLYPGYLEAARALDDAGHHGIAHKLDALRDEVDADFLFEQVPKAFARTFDGLNHVANIVRAMKAFAHPGQESLAPADLNEAISNTIAVARNEYKYVADVETELAKDLPGGECMIGELNQVFLNLIVNAAHAVAEGVEGTARRGHIRVRTYVVPETASVAIEISDDGTGIPEENKVRIFDPFFTTKPVGKGTGQGLTIALSIIHKHSGKLEVQSALGEGTTFKITLPIASRTQPVATVSTLGDAKLGAPNDSEAKYESQTKKAS